MAGLRIVDLAKPEAQIFLFMMEPYAARNYSLDSTKEL